jgi:3-oxoadipate enol-lactonase
MILASQISGHPDAPPLVLVGSLGTTKAMWRPQAGLADELRLIALDQRGHGESPVPAGPYTIGELAQDVLETLDELGVERFAFCGLSIGGMIGQWLGAHAADRVSALALLATCAVPPDASVFAERATLVRREGGAAGLVETLLPRWLTEGYRAAHPQDGEWLADMVRACPPEGYAGCAEAIAAMDLRDDLGAITAPTLVVGGEQDGSIPPAVGAEPLAAAIPGARYELLDPGGHLLSVERAETLDPWLRELVTAAR